MDFFSRQDAARRKTKLLVLYFSLAVAGIVGAIYFIVLFLFGSGRSLWNPDIFFPTALIVVLIVGLSSLSKILSLRGGGGVVARSLGGVQVNPSTTDPDERRLLNVVEEMALASGVPSPEVYILPHEKGINAFAAGFSVEDAAVGVTRGCIESLTRDELQGVIAHEFSHILNGDMRLNIRLLGIVFGILVIAVIGRSLMRSAFYVPRSRSSREGGGTAAIILAGVVIMAIGYIGVFFGRLIQAAVSRQREYLADAAAVQFTRNPDSIAGALKRIGSSGSRVGDAHCEDTAHMFFASALNSVFATHPPLEKRIRAIQPGWDGKFLKPAKQRDSAGSRSPKSRPSGAQPIFRHEALVGLAGLAGAEHLIQARETREAVEASLGEAVHTPREARALVFSLLLDPESGMREAQLEYLKKEYGDEFAGSVRAFYPKVVALGEDRRLPLLDLTLPSLALLEKRDYADFIRHLDHLVVMDGHTTIFEFALTQIVHRYLKRRLEKPSKTPPALALAPLATPFARVLSAVVFASESDHAQARARFLRALRAAPLMESLDPEFLEGDEIGFEKITSALDALSSATYAIRKQVLAACAAAAADDGELHQHEYEMLRAIAGSLECPLPPQVLA